ATGAHREPAGRPARNFERRADRCQPLRSRGAGRGAHQARVRGHRGQGAANDHGGAVCRGVARRSRARFREDRGRQGKNGERRNDAQHGYVGRGNAAQLRRQAMNTVNYSGVNLRRTLIATTVASVLLAACAAAPLKPDGAAEVRNKLTQLQSDPNLAGRAPLALKEAGAGGRAPEQPQADQELAAYRVYLADRKVDT